jgi:hypothetical protein
MSLPKFSITNYLESCQGDLEQLRKTLFDKGVFTKDFVEEGLMLLYHKYDAPITTELERECRSLIIDRTTLKIKSYSCETPRVNKEGMDFLLANSTEPQIINVCYEGTYLSVFNHNAKWYVSTRRCLDSNDSVFDNGVIHAEKSHFKMLEEVLNNAGYSSFNEFTQKLNPDNSYYFVLIHHQNKHMINYTNQFGEKYGKICLTTIRDSEMRELDIYTNKVDFASYTDSNTSFVFVPEKLSSIDDFANSNKQLKYDSAPDSEGIVIRVWSSETSKNHLIKLQNTNYQFALVLGSDRNMFKGLLYLYQTDKLVEYFTQNANAYNMKKIVNPLNTSESYDTVGTVDAVFKVCTSETFELFKLLWSIKNGQHQNKELYEMLPKEYKDVMFAVRGLYYKKKASFYKKDGETSVQDIKNSHLKINDIYNYMKSIPTEQFVAFLRMRKLMFNWVKNNQSNTNLKEFGSITSHCDKVHVKLCAIFTNKLYPNIMPNDVPPQKEALDLLKIIVPPQKEASKEDVAIKL